MAKAAHVASVVVMMSVVAECSKKQWDLTDDRWYVVEVTGKPAGYLHTTVKTRQERVKTTEVMKMAIKRGDDLAKMKFQTDFLEYTNGTAKYASYNQELSDEKIQMKFNFGLDQIQIVSTRAGREHTNTAPSPDRTWLPRWASKQAFKKGCLAGEKLIEYSSIRPEMGPELVNCTSVFSRHETTDVLGKPTKVSVWEVAVSGIPLNTTETYIAEGEGECETLTKMQVHSAFGLLESTISTQKDAEDAAESLGGADGRPELVYSLFVPLADPIPGVSQAVSVQYQVTVLNESFHLTIPTAGYQTVMEDSSKLTKLVSVDLLAPVAATPEELRDPHYTEPSAMVDSNDPLVRELAFSLLDRYRDHPSPLTPTDKANILRAGVREHITDKNLVSAFASASETVRTQAGDCSEHGVLLAALLRVADIPSRTCSGLVYVERLASQQSQSTADGEAHTVQVDHDGAAAELPMVKAELGWHMWSQGLIDGHWMDLDATLHVPYSVGHILLGTSSLADAEGHKAEVQLAAMIGNLGVKVVDVKYA